MTKLENLIQKGIVSHKAGNLREAESIYKLILKRKKTPLILHLLGVINYQNENYLDALKLINEALRLQPNYPAALSNLGNTYRKIGNYEKAIECYEKSLEFQPNFIDVLSNLGSIYLKMHNYELAKINIDKALAINHNFLDALKNKGSLLISLNKLNDAGKIYKDILELDPSNIEAKFLVSALTGENIKSPPIEYIESLFDNYSSDFENHLINKLNYETPKLIFEYLNKYISKNIKYEALDLGCGSGLLGLELKSIIGSIDGVDISSGMLKQAAKKSIYSKLIKNDIIKFLNNNLIQYDLVVSSDVFNYFGDLTPVFKNIKNSLSSGGLFCFTVEAFLTDKNNEDFLLQANGRYKHQKKYILKMIENFKLDLIECADIVIRKEKGIPVPAHVFICCNWKTK